MSGLFRSFTKKKRITRKHSLGNHNKIHNDRAQTLPRNTAAVTLTHFRSAGRTEDSAPNLGVREQVEEVMRAPRQLFGDVQEGTRIVATTTQAFLPDPGSHISDNDFSRNQKFKRMDMASCLDTVHRFSYTQVLVAISKIAKGRFHGEMPKENKKEVPLPNEEIWDFKLGDWVQIKYTEEKLASVHKRTVGYRKELNQCLGQVGIVETMFSKYANFVGVYFPGVFEEYYVYPGALEKVESSEQSTENTRLKAGVYVQTVDDRDVLDILQKRFCKKSALLDAFPEKHIGERGKVLWSFKDYAYVTFDNILSYAVSEAALIVSDNQNPMIIEGIAHPDGYCIGDKAKVISNIKNLIEYQKESEGWNKEMSCLTGQVVTVIYIYEDGNLLVQLKHGRPWKLNSKSVLKLDEEETKPGTGLDFVPGDIVEFHRQSTGKVIQITKQLQPVVKFGDVTGEVRSSILKKASAKKIEAFNEKAKRVENLKTGDTVLFDVGPPNFVRSVMSEINADYETRMALTKPAKVLRYFDNKRVVIQYDSGIKYKVVKKFLTVLDEFGGTESLDVDTIKRIQDTIKEGVDAVKDDKTETDDSSVELLCLAKGRPPNIKFQVNTNSVKWTSLLNWLKENSGWNIIMDNDIGHGLLSINGIRGFKGEVTLGITMGDNELEMGHEKGLVSRKRGLTDAPVRPISDEPVSAQQPKVCSVQDFRYMRLHHPALGRDLYLPCVFHGSPCESADMAQDNLAGISSARHIHNHTVVYNLENSKIGNLNNINEQNAGFIKMTRENNVTRGKSLSFDC